MLDDGVADRRVVGARVLVVENRQGRLKGSFVSGAMRSDATQQRRWSIPKLGEYSLSSTEWHTRPCADTLT